jgi:hypothetical protein
MQAMYRWMMFLGALASLLVGGEAAAQNPNRPVIDTIVITTFNVYDPAEAQSNALFRLMNAVRFTTRRSVVRRELLFRKGEPFDSAAVAETERNLRGRGIFRVVAIDTARIGDRFAVFVHTGDAWSTQLVLNARAIGGSFAWATGLVETNFLGTGNSVSAIYQDDPDRNSVTLGASFPRFFASRVQATGVFADLSDGTAGGWQVGLPFRALSDRSSIQLAGEAADRRVLQYRVRTAADVDTTRFQRRAFTHRFTGAFAPVRGTGGYLRVGGSAQLRREEYVRQEDTSLVIPDTIKVAVGAFVEYRKARFKVVNHFNGFTHDEDLDLSTVVRVSTWIAPSAFGFDRDGVGPAVGVRTGISLPAGFATIGASANGLYSGAGLDSGQVRVTLTLGMQFIPRQTTFIHFEAGAQENPTPGGEFDLGFGIGPRSFGPHAFVGTRTVWGTFEHRMFIWDQLLGNLGLGFATYLDYGGAWYPDQPARVGGSVGFGIRTGFSRASGANIGRFDVAYRFGDGFTGSRWVLSFGRGFLF